MTGTFTGLSWWGGLMPLLSLSCMPMDRQIRRRLEWLMGSDRAASLEIDHRAGEGATAPRVSVQLGITLRFGASPAGSAWGGPGHSSEARPLPFQAARPMAGALPGGACVPPGVFSSGGVTHGEAR